VHEKIKSYNLNPEFFMLHQEFNSDSEWIICPSIWNLKACLNFGLNLLWFGDGKDEGK
jgi:hypothetical protein